MTIFYQALAVLLYITVLFVIGFMSVRRHMTSNEYIIGGRQLNFMLTALAAHASDMSNWLFMGLPAVIFLTGLFNTWFAVGLVVFMFLNWQLIAPKIRIQTEKYNSMTFSSFFESRFADTSGLIRIFTAMMSLFYYTIYISAGVIGIGYVIHSLFGIGYHYGISIGVLVIIPYLLAGGYTTLAWIDLFQGLFLLCVIVFVPLYALPKVGGFHGIADAVAAKGLSFSFVQGDFLHSLKGIVFLMCMWGLGYFGQPHIVTKFMGIRDVKLIPKSKAFGMSWQVLTLTAGSLIGLIAIPFFKGGIANAELVFIDMVKELFHPFVAGVVLCAILAATISTIDSQILVLASSLSEDIYRKVFRKNASSKELLRVTRLCVILTTLLAYSIAFFELSTIYNIVHFAWSGLGSAFGPLLIFALYTKKTNKYGAWAGILVGGIVAAIWPFIDGNFLHWEMPQLIPGFVLSSLSIWCVSLIFRNHHPHHLAEDLG